MTKQTLTIGLTVAVSSQPDAQLYRIKSLSGFEVGLEYWAPLGRGWVSGGTADASSVRVPTDEQLRNGAGLPPASTMAARYQETAELSDLVGEAAAAIFNLAAVEVLLLIAGGRISANKLAREQLAARGLNHEGKWIGHDAASGMWLGK